MNKAAAALSRIHVLDLLRGYFLLVILLNHLHYYPSGFEWITGQSFLYTSTAEGFFLLSGIVLGMVRGAKLIDKPFKLAATLLLKRSLQLYITSIVLVFLFTFIGWFFVDNPGVKWGVWQPIGEFGALIWNTLTLQYNYGWADYLRLYAIFIFFSPLAIWLLRKGYWYILLAASFGVWTLYPFSPWPAGEYSQQFSWQLIFFTGLIVGFYWKQINTWWLAQAVRIRRIVVASIVSISVVTLIFNALIVFGDGIPAIGPTLASWDNALSSYFAKDRLPIPRLILFGLWFISLYWLFWKFEKPITRRLGWLLLPFGTNSLYTYTIQAFVVFFLMLIFNDKPYPWYINLTVSLSAIALVYAAVRTKFLMKIIPR